MDAHAVCPAMAGAAFPVCTRSRQPLALCAVSHSQQLLSTREQAVTTGIYTGKPERSDSCYGLLPPCVHVRVCVHMRPRCL